MKKKYKIGDIVTVKSKMNKVIPKFHVRLLEKKVVKESKGNNMDWPGYIGWECELIYKKEADMLRKKFQVPFKFPNDIATFVYEDEIIS
tara:strand:- start:279 stop:545 length:267 start_codon:yes stop_codon:yes gene_type:complete